jgi:hypothetical protein
MFESCPSFPWTFALIWLDNNDLDLRLFASISALVAMEINSKDENINRENVILIRFRTLFLTDIVAKVRILK